MMLSGKCERDVVSKARRDVVNACVWLAKDQECRYCAEFLALPLEEVTEAYIAASEALRAHRAVCERMVRQRGGDE